MRYSEYLECADKHRKACASLLLSYKPNQKYDKHVWLDLYYLSGYIIEGIVIYSAYKLNNWRSSDDIKIKYNLEFSQTTNLDFYYKREFHGNVDNRTRSFFQNRSHGALSVQGHRFQEIAKTLLRPNPSFNGIPYLGDGIIDKDVENLIDKWCPEIRYLYAGKRNSLPTLSQDLIAKLLNTCFTIYINHI